MNQQPDNSPWRTVEEIARRAKTGKKLIYSEAAAGRLRVARVGGRREIRARDEWIDQWLEASAPMEVAVGERRR